MSDATAAIAFLGSVASVVSIGLNILQFRGRRRLQHSWEATLLSDRDTCQEIREAGREALAEHPTDRTKYISMMKSMAETQMRSSAQILQSVFKIAPERGVE